MSEKKKKDPEAELDKLDERFAYGVFDDKILYDKLRIKKQTEIDQIKEQLQASDIEISTLNIT